MSKLYDVLPSFAMLNSTSPTPALRSLLPASLQPFLFISYPIRSASSRHPSSSSSSSTILYGKGRADICFVISCALGLTIARELVMRYILAGIARWYLSRKRRAATGGEVMKMQGKKAERARRKREHVVLRFSEQGWSFLYCTFMWSLGAYILSLIPSPLSPQSLWAAYPHTPIPKLTKFYYLAQLGWWFHQIYVINTEKRRHDHWQMFSHHILTIALVVGSYIGNFTRIGTVLHVLMDFCDILLPFAKMSRYLGLTTLCDVTFVLFLISWIITRQVGLAYLIRTSCVDAPRLIPYKWSPSTEHYHTYWGLRAFIAMEVILLGLATMWLFMAMRVAVRVIRGLGAEDSRSDEEDEGEEEGEKEQSELHIDIEDREKRTPTSSTSTSNSNQSSPAWSLSGDEPEVTTPKGVEALGVGLGVGVHVPEALKGLQCKRDFTREGQGQGQGHGAGKKGVEKVRKRK